MGNGKGMVAGFAAGLAVAVGAFLLLHEEAAVPASEGARIAELSAQIDRLERSVSRLAVSTGGVSPTAAPVADESTPSPKKETTLLPEQQKIIASADAMVDQAIQTGQWTRLQARDLGDLTADLSAEERGRIMARISAAINADQIHPELR